MNIGAVLVLLKLLQESGLTKQPPTPPTAEVGVRPPSCAPGMKIVFKENPDRYVCVPSFK